MRGGSLQRGVLDQAIRGLLQHEDRTRLLDSGVLSSTSPTVRKRTSSASFSSAARASSSVAPDAFKRSRSPISSRIFAFACAALLARAMALTLPNWSGARPFLDRARRDLEQLRNLLTGHHLRLVVGHADKARLRRHRTGQSRTNASQRVPREAASPISPASEPMGPPKEPRGGSPGEMPCR